MNHVLEHLYEPQNVLSHLLAKLKPGGAIHIAVPNPYGISARLFRSRWFSLEAPRHLMIYSPAGLKRVLSVLGFVDIDVVHERTPKDFSRSIGYVLRDLKLVKPELVQGMGDETLLNSWLAPLLWLAGGKGYGDRIHAFARKPEIPTASKAFSFPGEKLASLHGERFRRMQRPFSNPTGSDIYFGGTRSVPQKYPGQYPGHSDFKVVGYRYHRRA